MKKMTRDKRCHDSDKAWHDSTRQNACSPHWEKCVMMAKMWHDSGNPNSDGLLHKAKTCHDLLKTWNDL